MSTGSPDNVMRIHMIEEILTLKLGYLYGFSISLSKWATLVYAHAMWYNQNVRIILMVMFFILGIVSWMIIGKMN